MCLLPLAAATVVVIVVCALVNSMLRRQTVSSSGKAVLITGCDHGFGFMLAVKLSALGYRVFATCLNAAGEGAEKLRMTSSNIDVIQLDVTDAQQVSSVRTYVAGQMENQGLWALVNNAGIGSIAETEWCPVSLFQDTMNVNWLGTVRVTHAFLPLIRAARGRVISMGSIAARLGIPGSTAYCSSKYAVIGFSDGLRREMAKFGVKVITIEPFGYKTPILEVSTVTGKLQKLWRETSQEIRHQYGVAFFKADLAKLTGLLMNAREKVSEVVDDLTHAVTSAYPYTRYVPGPPTNQLFLDLLSSSPNLFQGWVLDWIRGVPLAPAAARSFRD